jgi:hypothetical protein
MKKIEATHDIAAELVPVNSAWMSPNARFVAVVLNDMSEKPRQPTASARQARLGIVVRPAGGGVAASSSVGPVTRQTMTVHLPQAQ